ncbi:MAG: peroxiredoxin family protein [Bacillus sp. (in: firmicutes)]
MIKKIIAGIVLVSLIVVAMVQAMEKKDESTTKLPGLEESAKAPNFTLQTLKGETVSLEDYKGKKVVLNLWATWCGPCRKEMPDMQKFYEQNPNGNYEILAINLDPVNDVQGFVDELSLTFPIVLDSKGDMQKAYEVLSIPYTYFIDEDGIIYDRHPGLMSYSDLEEKINL